MSKVNDIYFLNKGESVQLHLLTPRDEIYQEAMDSNKFVTIRNYELGDNNKKLPLLHLLVTAVEPNELTISEFIDHYALTSITDPEFFTVDEDVIIEIPTNLNLKSVRSLMSKKMKEIGRDIKIVSNANYLFIRPKERSIDYDHVNTMVKDDTWLIDSSQINNFNTVKVRLYRIAERLGIKLSVINTGKGLTVTHQGPKDDSNSFLSDFKVWLESLPYDVETPIPSVFTERKPMDYIRVVLNKHKEVFRIHNGAVIRREVALVKKNKQVHVNVRGESVVVLDINSLTKIGARERDMVDIALAPYSRDYWSVRNA